MKRIKKRLIGPVSLVMTVILFIGMFTATCYAMDNKEQSREKNTDLYEYRITPSDPEWENLEVQERWDISNIPEEYAATHSTNALLLSLLKCPFISNIYYFDTPKEGIDVFRNDFPAMGIFLNRDNALEELYKYKSDYETNRAGIYGEDSREYFEYLIVCDLFVYLQNKSAESANLPAGQANRQISYVQTPNGSNVMVYVGLTYSDHNTTQTLAHQVTLDAVTNYNATIISYESPSYNCHAYAWYSTTYTNYWMSDPSAYMSDGSYSGTTTPLINRRITYKTGATLKHSGVISSINGGIVNVKSKWGCAGVLRHEETHCVYYMSPSINATNVEFWKAN
jgi:hypothetical protein